MFEWFFNSLTGLGDFFSNWYGLLIGTGIIIMLILGIFAVYVMFKSYFGV